MSVNGKHFYRFQYLKGEEWAFVRKMILAERKAKCCICKTIDWSNDVHHMIYRKNLKCLRSDFKVLCRHCHRIAHFVLEHRKRMGEEKPKRGWNNAARAARRITRQSTIIGIDAALERAKTLFNDIYQRNCDKELPAPWLNIKPVALV